MFREIHIPEYFDHNAVDAVLKEADEIKSSPNKATEGIKFDFTKANFIASDFPEYKCLAVYQKEKEKEHIPWMMKVMGITKADETGEINEFLDKFRVPIQRCFYSSDSLKAINEKLIPIVKEKYNPSKNVLKSLNWGLWEAIDNAGVHGYGQDPSAKIKVPYPKPVTFCAWAYKDEIEIGILDSGQGIRNSFTNSGIGKYKCLSNTEALKIAIQKGETSNPENSMGFGLYGCAELARQSGGHLVIISTGNKLVLDDKGINIYDSYTYNGTIVSLCLSKKMDINLDSIFGKNSFMATEDFDDILGDYE
jgi:anti-sigma regulatory factor (Ser/Thr protein kinase)